MPVSNTGALTIYRFLHQVPQHTKFSHVVTSSPDLAEGSGCRRRRAQEWSGHQTRRRSLPRWGPAGPEATAGWQFLAWCFWGRSICADSANMKGNTWTKMIADPKKKKSSRHYDMLCHSIFAQNCCLETGCIFGWLGKSSTFRQPLLLLSGSAVKHSAHVEYFTPLWWMLQKQT